jgi:hypothetical protein
VSTLEHSLKEIARGRISPSVVRPWRIAEFRRHLILLEAVRRRVLADGPADDLVAAHQRLAEAERADPERAFTMLAAPQIGVWAARCLRAPDASDTGYLQKVVAELAMPPPEPAIRVVHHGLTLALTMDRDDPYLDLYGDRDPAPDLAAWREVVDAGWRLLTAQVHPVSAAMAETLRILVPLRQPGPGKLRSATSGWAFGAIATSLPRDEVECAETLLHEFRHVVLGAIINHVPLVDQAARWTGHAPWRSDPRPAEGLLQGCFAYAGLIGLWRRLLSTEHHDQASAELGTWYEATRAALAELAGSGALTAYGLAFTAAMGCSL